MLDVFYFVLLFRTTGKCWVIKIKRFVGYLPTPRVQKPGDNPKIFKVGAILISGTFWGISLFSMQEQYITYEINE